MLPAIDLSDAAAVIHVLEQAAAMNLTAAGRHGSVVDLGRSGQLVMTGDLHDHDRNLRRILHLAELDKSKENHLVLHEIIHGVARVNGMDVSIRTLARVAALKLHYPEQVHLLLANHELAQIAGEGILKNGANVVEIFNEGIEYLYGDDFDAVFEAMVKFVRSLLLGVRCANGIMCTHSLPSPRHVPSFDATVIDRVPGSDDLAIGGAAHSIVWGRSHTQSVADAIAPAWHVGQFVMGHQRADMGYETEGDTMLILASDHDHGVALPIDLSKRYSREDLIKEILPLNGVIV